MNWIERLPEVKGKDLYSQNGEGLILEYMYFSIGIFCSRTMYDIGSGDNFILSNSRHLRISHRFNVLPFEKEKGLKITIDNCTEPSSDFPAIISIDIDGNDYWILNEMLPHYNPLIVVAEFNPAFTDNRIMKYNPDHEWAGDDYYGMSFKAGESLAEKHGYKVIWQTGNMNMFMVRQDLIQSLNVPPVTFKEDHFFKPSGRPDSDWVIF